MSYFTYICWKSDIIRRFFICKNILKKLSCYHNNYFRYFMFRKYNGFVSKARVSACMYFLVGSYMQAFSRNYRVKKYTSNYQLRCLHHISFCDVIFYKLNVFGGVYMEASHAARCPRKFGPPPKNLAPPPAKFPKEIWPPGNGFLGNMASPSEIWPLRKDSLLYRYKLGNREASSKTKILKVFVSIYS